MKFYFHPKAEQEFNNSVDYYENRQAGLGIEFAEEVCASIDRIAQYPEAWSEMSANTRRCLVNRFPYGVIFQIKAGILRIIAVSNLQRKPNHWRDRL